jgi:hypothetical protein
MEHARKLLVHATATTDAIGLANVLFRTLEDVAPIGVAKRGDPFYLDMRLCAGFTEALCTALLLCDIPSLSQVWNSGCHSTTACEMLTTEELTVASTLPRGRSEERFVSVGGLVEEHARQKVVAAALAAAEATPGVCDLDTTTVYEDALATACIQPRVYTIAMVCSVLLKRSAACGERAAAARASIRCGEWQTPLGFEYTTLHATALVACIALRYHIMLSIGKQSGRPGMKVEPSQTHYVFMQMLQFSNTMLDGVQAIASVGLMALGSQAGSLVQEYLEIAALAIRDEETISASTAPQESPVKP